jgi:GT2 family glycosyltransferase
MAEHDADSLATLSVVVLSHNRREELRRNLQVLCDLQGDTGFELIVVDNASDDGTREDLAGFRRQYPHLVVILSEQNLGVAGGRNLAWSAASRDFILNLDDDTRVDLHALRALCAELEASASVGIVTPRVVHALTGVCQNDYVGRVREPANFHGACHIVRRALWQRVGKLDPECSFGGEELDYTIRARAAGYLTVSAPQVTVLHNSLLRPPVLDRWRRERWLYNYSRVLFKHFPLGRALLYAGRGLFAHLASGVAKHGLRAAPALIANAALGARSGRRRYARLPEAVRRFYASNRLLPDFGNIPLWRKALARAGRGRAQAT